MHHRTCMHDECKFYLRILPLPGRLRLALCCLFLRARFIRGHRLFFYYKRLLIILLLINLLGRWTGSFGSCLSASASAGADEPSPLRRPTRLVRRQIPRCAGHGSVKATVDYVHPPAAGWMDRREGKAMEIQGYICDRLYFVFIQQRSILQPFFLFHLSFTFYFGIISQRNNQSAI
jgi:hypothetical protein